MKLAGGIWLCLCTLVLTVPRGAQANEFAKVLDEFFHNPIRRYQPDDPWTRSWIYRVQTGYAGKFRDCDNEEQKRFSPYICWKCSPGPTVKERFVDFIRCDIEEVKQRVRDGAGACCGARNSGGCTCKCRKHARRQIADSDQDENPRSSREQYAQQDFSRPDSMGASKSPDQFSDQFVASQSSAVDHRAARHEQVAQQKQRYAKARVAVTNDHSTRKLPNDRVLENNKTLAPVAVAHASESNDFVPPRRAKSDKRR